MKKNVFFAVLVPLTLALLCGVAFALEDIDVPDDFYDGGTRKAQVDALTAAVADVPAATAVTTGTTNTVAITAQGQGAAALAERRVIRVWSAETAYGAVSTNNVESLTLSGGAAVSTVLAHGDYWYLTSATGTASAVLVATAAGTNYLMVADGGCVSSTAVVFE